MYKWNTSTGGVQTLRNARFLNLDPSPPYVTLFDHFVIQNGWVCHTLLPPTPLGKRYVTFERPHSHKRAYLFRAVTSGVSGSVPDHKYLNPELRQVHYRIIIASYSFDDVYYNAITIILTVTIINKLAL